ncbi:MAG: dihydroorotate dehydrogenase electron transfer subunit [Desulfobacteraceae bacterium]|nr:dihydroorotate dehydrogenase electron transfer subunit [Desulfobacteraceae bacterium]
MPKQEGKITMEKKPVMLRIDEVQRHNESYATLFFKHELQFIPGQFVMLWLPEIDEKPYTVSSHSKERFGVTVEAKGRFSTQAVALSPGDLVGVRGPFGNGFSFDAHANVCFVAGGCGIAPLAPMIESVPCGKTIIQGARSGDHLLFKERFAASDVLYTTDDGSFGQKGFVTEVLADAMAKNMFDMVYTCGPEVMMKKVFDLCEANSVRCQISLERYMRCGFGVCGACVCGKERVCVDGPVFESQRIRTLDDFNKKALLKSGKEVTLTDYFSWRSA